MDRCQWLFWLPQRDAAGSQLWRSGDQSMHASMAARLAGLNRSAEQPVGRTNSHLRWGLQAVLLAQIDPSLTWAASLPDWAKVRTGLPSGLRSLPIPLRLNSPASHQVLRPSRGREGMRLLLSSLREGLGVGMLQRLRSPRMRRKQFGVDAVSREQERQPVPAARVRWASWNAPPVGHCDQLRFLGTERRLPLQEALLLDVEPLRGAMAMIALCNSDGDTILRCAFGSAQSLRHLAFGGELCCSMTTQSDNKPGSHIVQQIGSGFDRRKARLRLRESHERAPILQADDSGKALRSTHRAEPTRSINTATASSDAT